MIYYSFKNYEEFKEMFGINEHGNGVKSRKNKILLSLFKQRSILHAVANAETYYWRPRKSTYIGGKEIVYQKWDSRTKYPFDVNLLECRSMSDLRDVLYDIMGKYNGLYTLHLNGGHFCSNKFKTDDFKGVCEDGDESSVRYVNMERNERVFKMKAGKLFHKLIEENAELDAILSEQVKIWICEQFAEEWKAYASQFAVDYDLHVDNNFSDIYDSYYLDDDFSSCMVNKDFHKFYKNCVKAKAAYLTKKGEFGDGDSIVARCIIFPEVHVCDSDETLRLAERQYASGGSDKLKRQLIMALINAGEIDGYKRIGAGCGDSRAFVDIHGNSLPSTDLWIDCKIDDDDPVSYQDSFKYYDAYEEKAYNRNDHNYDDELDITSGSIDPHAHEEWSSYNQEYIDSDEAIYVESRNDYFYDSQVCRAKVYSGGRYYSEFCFKDDCIEIDDEMYYAGDDAEYYENYGIVRCYHCGEYVLKEDAYNSDFTDEWYCCDDCMSEDLRERGYVFSDFDEKWYEDADDVTTAYEWKTTYAGHDQGFVWKYVETTISVDTLNDLVEDNEAAYVNGVAYIDNIGFDGEPVHIAAIDAIAA